MDRSEILASSDPEEIANAVHRVRKALDFGSGGVIAQFQWDPNVPLGNMVTAFEQWAVPMPMHA